MKSFWVDFIAQCSTITVKRATNFLKLYLGFILSRVFKKPVLLTYPAYFSIEPTTACNLKCPACPSGLRSFSRATGNLKMNTFDQSMKLLSEYSFSVTLYFQGEPFINPLFFDFVRKAKQHNLYTITSTNGHFLTEENCQHVIDSGLNRLIISVDGLVQETYSKYRLEGELSKVEQGIILLSNLKKKLKSKTPIIIGQFIAFGHNEHEVKVVEKTLKAWGVDQVQIKTAQIYDESQASTFLTKDPQLSRYNLNEDGALKLKNKMLNHCWRMWRACVITWDGAVVPCCFDKDASHKVGNINDVKDFKHLVLNKAYVNFRQLLLKSRQEIDICQNCTEGTKVFN